jgi:DNA-binding NtrC family response regulator
MQRPPDVPEIWIMQPDEGLRTRLASELRHDGMKVVEYASEELALAALRRTGKAAVLVTEPASGRRTNGDLARQAKTTAPRLEIIFTPASEPEAGTTPPGAHVLVKPLGVGKLSRFIRLVAAKPALRSELQCLYRQARSLQMDAARPAT